MIFEYGITDAQAEVPPIIKSVVVYQPKLTSVELTYTNPETGERRTVDEMDEEFERIEKGLSSIQWVTDPEQATCAATGPTFCSNVLTERRNCMKSKVANSSAIQTLSASTKSRGTGAGSGECVWS